MSAALRSSAEEVVGRRPRREVLPILSSRKEEEATDKQALKELWEQIRAAPSVEAAGPLRERHKQLKAMVRRKERRWRRELVDHLCNGIQRAVDTRDTRKFYAGLKELGLNVKETGVVEEEAYPADQAADHLWRISGGPNRPPTHAQVLEAHPQRPSATQLAAVPDPEEVWAAVKEMRVSAAGDDEVTIDMIRAGGPAVQKATVDLVQKLWREKGEHWEPSVVRGVVHMLWKRKGHRRDLDQYRGIVLLTIISRLVARIAATRLSRWAERDGLYVTEQFGFRPYRSTRDAILICRLMFEEAVRPDSSAHDDLMVLLLVDIKKAYPNVPRELCCDILSRFGVPEGLLHVLCGLHETTQYVVRTRNGDSEPYGLKRGLREGCPSSCVVYNLFHNAALQALKRRTEDSAIHAGTDLHRPLPRPNSASTELQEFLFQLLAFADDTTVPAKQSNINAAEQIVTEVLREYGEHVHPGKTEKICISPKTMAGPLPEGYFESIRLLGAWIDSDGGAQRVKEVRL